MNAKSVKRALGLAASAVGTTGLAMLAPTVANAATAHPAHVQTVSNVAQVSGGLPFPLSLLGGLFGGGGGS